MTSTYSLQYRIHEARIAMINETWRKQSIAFFLLPLFPRLVNVLGVNGFLPINGIGISTTSGCGKPNECDVLPEANSWNLRRRKTSSLRTLERKSGGCLSSQLPTASSMVFGGRQERARSRDKSVGIHCGQHRRTAAVSFEAGISRPVIERKARRKRIKVREDYYRFQKFRDISGSDWFVVLQYFSKLYYSPHDWSEGPEDSRQYRVRQLAG